MSSTRRYCAGFHYLQKGLLTDLGFDRLLALRMGLSSIRDVIAFPKTAAGQDLVVGSPSQVDEKILRDYHLTNKFYQY